jgi:fermentation-respiration switch protein FrsA (DUF1100 family)
MKRLLALAIAAALPSPAAAAAEPPNPFGHSCTPQNGVRFCPTANDTQRVPSWDGVPLDVDVTLPPSGDGPFPTIVMLHGFGGSKLAFEPGSGPNQGGGFDFNYSNLWYAQRGYAVINYSARGFGRSCGTPDSRTPPACNRGWFHTADQRYEARDAQYLLGLLADQRIVDPRAIGVTGVSYGGIQAQILARLRDRIRLLDGSFRRWRSPRGKRLRIAAAWARWSTADLTNALAPNGRFLAVRGTTREQSRRPFGVMKESLVNGLVLLGTGFGFLEPPDADPSADLESWKTILDGGEPYSGAALRTARELTDFHGAAGLRGPTAPLLVQNGWTDDLFPAVEALRVRATFKRSRRSRVSFQFGDLGHMRGSNKPNVARLFNNHGTAFFDAYLKGRGRKPRRDSVVAFTQTCPRERPGAGPFRARTWPKLHRSHVRLRARRRQRVTSGGGNPATGLAMDPVNGGGDACRSVAAERGPGTAVVARAVRRPFTMLGLPIVRAHIRTRGPGGLLGARLWDVHRGQQIMISRGVYRLRNNQRGRLTFQLFGNGWRFRRGHTAKLELLGSDPHFLRTSNDRFSVRISRIGVRLPAR